LYTVRGGPPASRQRRGYEGPGLKKGRLAGGRTFKGSKLTQRGENPNVVRN